MADLTLEQRSAAESRGCRFVPATGEQIATLAMQRRVFWLDGQAFLAMRPDGFFETAATLQRLLRQPLPEPVRWPDDPQPTAPAFSDPAAASLPPPEAGRPEGRSLPAKPARSKRRAPARVSSPALPSSPQDKSVQPSQAALVETVQLVSAYLSAHPVSQWELDALIRDTHQTVLRIRASRCEQRMGL
ncbi:MAG TPA: hypothetical protein VNZ61_26110 [Roseomonas sp.]|nr:hypothetical protein [Roseomonas sp.]